MRKTLTETKISPKAQEFISHFHTDVVNEIEQALQTNEWVVVGMAQNPFVGKARNLLKEKNINFKYIEFGSYFSQWKQRLAIKIWSGWPTFPQVFHKGVLIGGFKDLESYIATLK